MVRAEGSPGASRTALSGVKNITLGPKLPAFVSPAVLDVLVKQFDLKPNTTVEADLARMVPA